LQKLSFDPLDINNAPTLQLIDVSTRKIMVSVPIKTEIIEVGDGRAISEWNTTVPDALSFSPDSRYIAFPTSGSIILKDAQFPTKAIAANLTGLYLNILDLKTEQLVQSLPMNDFGENLNLNLLWSPNSDKFVYQDGSENWQLFELSNHTIFPITQHNGSQLPLPAWSYDGAYLSFSSQYHSASGPPKSFIIDLSNFP
jgi:Tol biopolymer transport system component